MTRITILEQKLVQLQEKRNQAGIVCRDLEEARIDIISRMIHEYFEEVLEEGDTIKVSSDRVEFTRPQEGYKYNKELLTLYFNSKDWRDEEADRIETSFYSTSENSEYELRRMVLIGKVGQIVLDFKDDILGKFNQIKADTKEELSKARKVEWGIEKEIREVNNQIDKIKKENLFSKLEKEGIEFELPEDKSVNELPNIDVKFNRIIYNIKGLQIVGKTASGKSADLRLKVMSNIWNPDTKSYNEKEDIKVVEKVRMDNIERFLQYNSERISAS
jgi:hypothetical protein